MHRFWTLPIMLFSLLGCRAEIHLGDPIDPPGSRTVTTDFNNGAGQWRVAVSDVSDSQRDQMLLSTGIAPLPDDVSGQGYRLLFDNPSADAFVFLRYPLSGLPVSTNYRVTASVTLLTRAGTGCAGVGGAPGESVVVKVGAVSQRPQAEGYYLNADKGNGSSGGSDAKVVGHIGSSQLGCDSNNYAAKTLDLSAQQGLSVVSDPQGLVWVFVGLDAGYEGDTSVYLTDIRITLSP